MTPYVLDWEIVGEDKLIELSKGTGLEGEVIYGVTQMVWEDMKWQTTRKGLMFGSKEQQKARAYYNNLKVN